MAAADTNSGTPTYRQATYKNRAYEVFHPYKGNSVTVNASIPTFLYDRWKELKAEGMRLPLGALLSRALHFGFFGPHPYDDPIDGLDDAIQAYEEMGKTRQEIAADVMRKIGKQYGVDPKSL